MRIRYWVCLPALLLAGCASGPPADVLRSAERRELTQIEKTSLTVSLAQTLKDPGSTQFKWVPIIVLEREGVTDYCGLVNGRNSYGGYTGFEKFYAQLYKNPKGEFNRGQIRLIASSVDNVSVMATNGACDQFGYTDFSQAK
jgi:hypothetical protein